MNAYAKLTAVMAIVVPLSACGGAHQHEIGGTVIGGVAGATVGSLFGRGVGRVASTLVGASVGAYLGNRVGASLDGHDNAYAAENADYAMTRLPSGQASSWNNTATGNSGTIAPVSPTYIGQNGLPCRRFREVITLRGGKTDIIEGERCQKADGTWIYTR